MQKTILLAILVQLMDIADTLEKALGTCTADVSVLRWMNREQTSVTLVDGVPRISQTTFEGVSCRSLINGSWGFASTTDGARTADMVKTAERLAGISFHTEKSALADVEPVSGEWIPDVTLSHAEDLLVWMKEAEQAAKSVPLVKTVRIGILSIMDEKMLRTSEGTRIHQREPRILGTVSVIAKKGGIISQGIDVVGGYGTKCVKEGLLQTAVMLAERVSRKIGAGLPPAEKVPVVLSGDVVGLLTHEAVGHAAEADNARTSFLSQKSFVASPLITIVDNGLYPGGFGSYGFDDEGVPSQETVIISNGVLQSYIHSRETAYQFQCNSTGNARAWLFSREPLVRMSNTYVVPQDLSFEELLEPIKEGLYLSGVGKGSADHNGQFIIVTQNAQKIEKGELTDTYYVGPTISGNAVAAFSACTGVGDDNTFVVTPSLCGKGESAFVGSGGPAVATTVQVGGV